MNPSGGIWEILTMNVRNVNLYKTKFRVEVVVESEVEDSEPKEETFCPYYHRGRIPEHV